MLDDVGIGILEEPTKMASGIGTSWLAFNVKSIISSGPWCCLFAFGFGMQEGTSRVLLKPCGFERDELRRAWGKFHA